MTEPLSELVTELHFAEEEVAAEVSSPKPKTKPKKEVTKDPEVQKKREELQKMSADGLIKQSVASLTKSSDKTINKIYNEVETKQLERVVEHLCDVLLSRLSQIMGVTGVVADPEKLEADLKGDLLLCKDVESTLNPIASYMPFMGLLSGGITVGKHIYASKAEGEVEKDPSPSTE